MGNWSFFKGAAKACGPLLLAMIASTVGHGAQLTNCLSPVDVTNPDMSKVPPVVAGDLSKMDQVPIREIRYSFTPSRDRGRDWITTKETIVADISEPVGKIRSDVLADIAHAQTCNIRISVDPFDFLPDRDGDLHGNISLPSTIRACLKFDFVCSKNLMFYRCYQTWITDIDHATFGLDVWIHLTANPSSNTISIKGSSRFDDRGYKSNPFRNFVLNLIGIATFNAGSKLILDNYNAKLSEINAMIAAVQPSFFISTSHRAFGDLLPSGEPRRLIDDLKLDPSETRFSIEEVGSPGRPYKALRLAFNTDPVRRATFCKAFRPYFEQLGAYFRSTVVGDVEHVVAPGETLWSIARDAYGDGHFQLALLRPNSISFGEMNRLRTGERLKVPAMYKLWKGSDYLIRDGDSLWQIARTKLGSPARSDDLYRENKKFLQSPNRVYPVQSLDVGP